MRTLGVITDIRASATDAASALESLDRDGARAVLRQLQVEFRTLDGRARPGVIRLTHRGAAEQPIGFERSGANHLQPRQRGRTVDTARALQTVFKRAQLPEVALRDLERYLSARGNRAGVADVLAIIDQYLPVGADRPVD